MNSAIDNLSAKFTAQVSNNAPTFKQVAEFATWLDAWLTTTTTDFTRKEKLNAVNSFFGTGANNFFARQGLAPAIQALGTHIKSRIDAITKNQDSLQGPALSVKFGLEHLDDASKALDTITPTKPTTNKYTSEEQKELFTVIINNAINAAQKTSTSQEYQQTFQTIIKSQLQEAKQVFSQEGITAIQSDMRTVERELQSFKALATGGSTIQKLITLDSNKDKDVITLLESLNSGETQAVDDTVKEQVATLLQTMLGLLKESEGNQDMIKRVKSYAIGQLDSPEKKAYYTYLTNKYQEMHANKFDVEAISQIMSKSLPGILFGGGLGMLFGSTWLGMIVGVIVDMLSKEKQETTSKLAAPENERPNKEGARASVEQEA